jgi:hypothetical protein
MFFRIVTSEESDRRKKELSGDNEIACQHTMKKVIFMAKVLLQVNMDTATQFKVPIDANDRQWWAYDTQDIKLLERSISTLFPGQELLSPEECGCNTPQFIGRFFFVSELNKNRDKNNRFNLLEK